MSSKAAAPGPDKEFLRTRFPVVVPVVAGVVGLVVWFALPADWMRLLRVMAVFWVVLPAAVLAELVWFMTLSGLRRSIRFGAPALCAGLAVAAVERVEMDGDMLYSPVFRWSPGRADLVEKHRQQAKLTGILELVAEKETDWPEYRGRRRDGVALGSALARDWDARPPRQLWRQPCGGGYSSFAIQGGLGVTLEQRRDQEVVVAYDAATGNEVWTHAYPAHFQELLGGPGPRATPTIADGMVYSLGATGVLVCLDLRTGSLKWSANVLGDNDNLPWGMSGSPLVRGNLVVVNPGAQRPAAAGRALVALEKASGKVVWSGGDSPAGYASPMGVTLAGREQILLFDGDGLAGHDPETGKPWWSVEWKTHERINVAQPLVLDGDRVFISSGYGRGCALYHVAEKDGTWFTQELWRNNSMRCRFTSPVAYQGHLYGLDEGILVCLDARTGQRLWKDGRYGHGQLLLSGNLLVVLAENGDLALVEATPEGYRPRGRTPAVQAHKTWNYPALSAGKVWVRNHEEMACYDLTEGN